MQAILIRLRDVPWLLAALFACQECAAQAFDARFEHVPIPLSNHSVTSILQDHQGYLWFGTHEGLNRWDGFEVVTYKHDPLDSTSLADNYISRVVEDSERRLWVTTSTGIQILDRTTNRFAHISVYASPSFSLSESHLRFLPGGDVLAIGDSTVYQFDAESERFHPLCPAKSMGGPLDLVMDTNDILWIAASDGLYRCRSDLLLQKVDDFRAQAAIRLMHLSRDGTLWAVRRHDVGIIDAADGRYMPRASFDEEMPAVPSFIGEDAEGRLWIGAQAPGPYLFDPKTLKLKRLKIDDPSSNPLSSTVDAIYIDGRQTVWLGTLGGVYRYAPFVRRFRFLGQGGPGLKTPAVVAIHEDQHSPGVLWVGTITGGLHRIHVRSASVEHVSISPDEDVHTPWTIRGGEGEGLWLAWDHGLLRFDHRRGRSQYFADERSRMLPRADEVQPMTSDGEGGFWVGANGGKVVHFDPVTKSFTLHLPPSPVAGEIRALYRSATGLWIGTSGDGLYRYDPLSGETVAYPHGRTDSTSLGGTSIWAIHESTGGIFWIGTTLGLSRFDPEKETFTNFYEQDGLPGAVVYSILEDDAGRLWLGTNHGLVYYDERRPDGDKFRIFDESDGIGNTEFNRRAALRAADGTMFFGGTNGLTWFHPDDIRENPEAPPVVITAIEKVGRAGSESVVPYGVTSLELEPGTSALSFEFAALDFDNPSKTRYRYRLEGIDSDWLPSGGRRYARYTNLAPGRYRFQVTGSNGDGVWNEVGTSIQVRVLPHIWQTEWFRLLAVLLFAGLLYGAYRYRVARLLEIQRLRLRIAGDLHDDIGSNLSSIALISDLVSRRTELTTRDKRQLSSVGKSAREMSEALREIVWFTNPGQDDLRDLVARMEDTAALMLNGTSHSFRHDGGDWSGRIDMEFRRGVYLIYKEILHNVVKHAEATRVDISVHAGASEFEVVVSDNGCGFDIEGGENGYGLSSLRHRAREIGATLSVESRPGHGTMVRLRGHLPRKRYEKYRREGMRGGGLLAKLTVRLPRFRTFHRRS